ncbi:unnamed protein product, partial [Didymodactylos carnosus]
MPVTQTSLWGPWTSASITISGSGKTVLYKEIIRSIKEVEATFTEYYIKNTHLCARTHSTNSNKDSEDDELDGNVLSIVNWAGLRKSLAICSKSLIYDEMDSMFTHFGVSDSCDTDKEQARLVWLSGFDGITDEIRYTGTGKIKVKKSHLSVSGGSTGDNLVANLKNWANSRGFN